MRLTYTDILNAHFRNIGKADITTDSVLLQDFQYSLGNRYQIIFGVLSSYINQDTMTSETEAGQQYYGYPNGTTSTDSATILIGSMRYTLTPIFDQFTWNKINAFQIQPTSIPQFIFPRGSDFGIWPIPTDEYTIEFNRFFRDKNMYVDDYSDGTITVTSGSATIVGSSTVWTSAMAGRWITLTDRSVPGQGYWYKISSVTDATHLVVEALWASDNASNKIYRIGESPEIPEEGHVILAAGTASDYYAGLRNDLERATWWNNVFWTGDGNNNNRDIHNKNVSGGLIGIYKRYKDRTRDAIVIRQPSIISPSYKIFSQTIS